MKEKNLTNEHVEKDPSLISDYYVKTGIFSRKLI